MDPKSKQASDTNQETNKGIETNDCDKYQELVDTDNDEEQAAEAKRMKSRARLFKISPPRK